MNTKIYTHGNDGLFVIMQKVITYGRDDQSGKSTEHYRFLNKSGRFDSVGTIEMPIFTWNDRLSAEKAADIVNVNRRCINARVIGLNETGCDLGEYFIEYCEPHMPALEYYLDARPFITEKERRLKKENDLEKLFLRPLMLLQIADATAAEMLAIQKDINAKYPGWSISSAARSLNSKKSVALIEQIRTGNIKTIDELSLDGLEKAIAIANKIITKNIKP